MASIKRSAVIDSDDEPPPAPPADDEKPIVNGPDSGDDAQSESRKKKKKKKKSHKRSKRDDDDVDDDDNSKATTNGQLEDEAGPSTATGAADRQSDDESTSRKKKKKKKSHKRSKHRESDDDNDDSRQQANGTTTTARDASDDDEGTTAAAAAAATSDDESAAKRKKHKKKKKKKHKERSDRDGGGVRKKKKKKKSRHRETAANSDDDDDAPSSKKRQVDDSDDEDDDESSNGATSRTIKEEHDPSPPMPKVESKPERVKKEESDDDYNGGKQKARQMKSTPPKAKAGTKAAAASSSSSSSPGKKKKEEAPQADVWKWWEEDASRKKSRDPDVKWTTLSHNGPVCAPEYEPLPDHVKFKYNGEVMKLRPDSEEVAWFYARMLEHEYTSKATFNGNFFVDWRSVMSKDERTRIKDLKKCDFSQMADYSNQLSEARKNRTKEEKDVEKKANADQMAKYGFAMLDGYKQKISNFKIEPPGLFRGRGEHPKMGKLKRRVNPEDITLNLDKKSPVPPAPPGHKWKAVVHERSVTWLATWHENIAGQNKYIMLNPASKLKGEKDWQKYEKARALHKCVDKIRDNYQLDMKSKDMKTRQKATALYLIDRLALRAGGDKDEDSADTVGCCNLRVEHIRLEEETSSGDECHVVHFDFLGKDSIRYQNTVEIEKRPFKNLKLFQCGPADKKGHDTMKKAGTELFDRLKVQELNTYLQEQMDGLTAKVFRTYNASITLQRQLDEMSSAESFALETVPSKMLTYNRANRAVAVLCNHQRSIPKTFDASMGNLQKKIDERREQVAEAQAKLDEALGANKRGRSRKDSDSPEVEKLRKAHAKQVEMLDKLNVQATDKEENKTIALSTSKLNYLDPRISIAWCKKHGVDVGKVFNKTQREKFQWAIDMVEGMDEEFVF